MITRFIKKSQRFRGFLLLSVVYFLLATFLTGCSDPRYLSEKLFYQAEKEVVKILKHDQKQLSQDNFDKVIAIYRKVVKTCPLENPAAKAQIIIANMYASRGKYREAQKEFKLIIQNFSSQPKIASSAQFAIGKLYESQGKWDKAIIEYEKVMDLYPLTPLGLNMPGYILKHYKNVNDQPEEEKAYKRAIKHYKGLVDEFSGTTIAPAIQDYLASLYLSQGDFKEAIKDNLQNAKAYFYLGVCLRKNHSTDSIEQLKQAIYLDSEYVEAYYELGVTYITLNMQEESIDSFKKALSIDQNHENSLIKLGATYIYLKRYKSAIKILEHAADYFNKAEAYYFLGISYASLSKNRKAIFAFKNAIEIDPDYIEPYLGLATSYIVVQSWTHGISLLNKAILIEPDNPNIHFLLGFLHLGNEDIQSAELELKILQKIKFLFRNHK